MKNYKLSTSHNAETLLEVETCCPMKMAVISVRILIDGQHDGRSWSKDHIDSTTNDLIESIMKDVKKEIVELVSKADPFSIHK